MGSPLFDLIGNVLIFWSPQLGQLIYVLGSLMWLIPDRQIARLLDAQSD